MPAGLRRCLQASRGARRPQELPLCGPRSSARPPPPSPPPRSAPLPFFCSARAPRRPSGPSPWGCAAPGAPAAGGEGRAAGRAGASGPLRAASPGRERGCGGPRANPPRREAGPGPGPGGGSSLMEPETAGRGRAEGSGEGRAGTGGTRGPPRAFPCGSDGERNGENGGRRGPGGGGVGGSPRPCAPPLFPEQPLRDRETRAARPRLAQSNGAVARGAVPPQHRLHAKPRPCSTPTPKGSHPPAVVAQHPKNGHPQDWRQLLPS